MAEGWGKTSDSGERGHGQRDHGLLGMQEDPDKVYGPGLQEHSMSWYARIPSPSNIADGPSRLDFSQVEEAFDVKMIEPVLDYEKCGVIG